MAKRRYRLRGTWKLIGIWTLVLLLVGGGNFVGYCGSSETNCEDILSEVLHWVLLAGAAVVLAILLRIAVSEFLKKRRSDKAGFANRPWSYDRKTVCLTGRVDRILKNSFSDNLGRHITNAVRTVIGSHDHTKRHVQQRFLLGSPDFPRGEKILVIHNTSFGKLKLKKRQAVRVKGIYIHEPSKKRTLFGAKLTYYGRIHHTHEPKGFVRPL